jgi:hypothetical protein
MSIVFCVHAVLSAAVVVTPWLLPLCFAPLVLPVPLVIVLSWIFCNGCVLDNIEERRSGYTTNDGAIEGYIFLRDALSRIGFHVNPDTAKRASFFLLLLLPTIIAFRLWHLCDYCTTMSME